MKKVLTWDQRFAEINAMRQRFAVVMSDLIRENDNIALVLADSRKLLPNAFVASVRQEHRYILPEHMFAILLPMRPEE